MEDGQINDAWWRDGRPVFDIGGTSRDGESDDKLCVVDRGTGRMMRPPGQRGAVGEIGPAP